MKIVIPYKPREHQKAVHKNLKRFNVLVCHRRFGKTVLCINELLKKAMQNTLPRPRYYYLAPTYSMSKNILVSYQMLLTTKLSLEQIYRMVQEYSY